MEKVFAPFVIAGAWAFFLGCFCVFIVYLRDVLTWKRIQQKCGTPEDTDAKRRFDLFTPKERRLVRAAIQGLHEWGSVNALSYMRTYALRLLSVRDSWTVVWAFTSFFAAVFAAFVTLSFWRHL